MLLFAEGFDDFSTVDDVGLTAAAVPAPLAGLPIVTTVAGRGGLGRGVKITPGGVTDYQQAYWEFAGASPVIIGFAMAGVGSFGLDGWNEINFLSGPTRLFTIRQLSPAGLSFYDATNPRYDKTTGLIGTAPFRNWSSYIQVKLTPGGSGSVIVKIDGVIAFSATGNFGGGNCDNFAFGIGSDFFASGFIDGSAYIDDLYVCDTTGAQNNDFLGDVRVTSGPPTGDGADTGFTPNSGSAHFSRVNEYPIDYDTTYVNAPAAGVSDTYTFGALPTPVGAIAAVQVRDYAKSDSGGTDKLEGIARIGGIDYPPPAGDQFVHAVYTGIDFIYELNPATGLPWTIGQVNAAEFGQKRTV